MAEKNLLTASKVAATEVKSLSLKAVAHIIINECVEKIASL
jgi:hypothetical protein